MTEKAQLHIPALMLVSDRSLTVERSLTEALLSACATDSICAIQLREKDLPAYEQLAIARQLKAALPASVKLIINDRIDVTLASNADGVQLGAGSIPIRDARRIAPDLLIGASVHTLEEAVEADRTGADYLIVGTMFATRSHPGKEPEGLTLMEAIRTSTALPLIGIGGITAENAASVMAAGAEGVAVISEILAASDPAAAARRLWLALQ